MDDVLYSCMEGDSSYVFKRIMDLFCEDGGKVLDMTFGRGVFWKKIEAGRFSVLANDMDPNLGNWHDDLRRVRWGDEKFDVVVFDPPWGNISTVRREDGLARVYRLEPMGSPEKLMEFCIEGIREGCRVLKVGGIMIVKCQDQVSSGKKYFYSVEIYREALRVGFVGVDRVIQKQKRNPKASHGVQKHFRMNYSEYWIFRKKAGK